MLTRVPSYFHPQTGEDESGVLLQFTSVQLLWCYVMLCRLALGLIQGGQKLTSTSYLLCCINIATSQTTGEKSKTLCSLMECEVGEVKLLKTKRAF